MIIIITIFLYTEWTFFNGNQIKEDKVGRAYSRYEEMEKKTYSALDRKLVK